MIKVFLLLCIIPWQLFAWDKESTTKIYHHVFQALTQKNVPKIYTKDKEYANIFETSRVLKVVGIPAHADVLLLTKIEDFEQLSAEAVSHKTILFTTSYKLLKLFPETVGAFYWRKGRSQLIFVQDRLKKKGINLPKEYQKFIVESL